MRRKRKSKTSTAEILLLAGALIALLLSSSACKEDSEPAPSSVQTKKTSEQKKNSGRDADKQESSTESKREYSYNPNGKVDPFTPLITSSPSSELTSSEQKEKKDVPLSPLQKLDVDDFHLVAVISTDKKLTALLEDPALNGFIVLEGMLIGRNGGVIKKILPNSMIVEELSVDEQGKKEMKIKTITLKKKIN